MLPAASIPFLQPLLSFSVILSVHYVCLLHVRHLCFIRNQYVLSILLFRIVEEEETFLSHHGDFCRNHKQTEVYVQISIVVCIAFTAYTFSRHT